jgi:hypothetical protein
MSRKKVSTTIYITPEQGDRLKLLHDRTKVPIAVYIREGIDMVLKHYEHMLPGQLTLGAGGGGASSGGASSSGAAGGSSSSSAGARETRPENRAQADMPQAAPSTPGRSTEGAGKKP